MSDPTWEGREGVALRYSHPPEEREVPEQSRGAEEKQEREENCVFSYFWINLAPAKLVAVHNNEAVLIHIVQRCC